MSDLGSLDPVSYDDKVRAAFQEARDRSDDGKASPVEVTEVMAEKGWLSELDTVIDIERIMRRTCR